MLQLSPQSRIFLAVEPVDFRKGIDGPAQLCQDTLDEDPFTGMVFCFRKQSSAVIKALVYGDQRF